MDPSTTIWLAALFFAAAILYSSVGHAGASGYLAAMALVGLAPEVMKPTALVLNILVATVGTVKFYRAGHFSWPLFWPFAVTSIPAAFLGGATTLPDVYYKPLVGVILLFAAGRFLFVTQRDSADLARLPSLPVALVAGGAIGLLSGLVGVGGGIFLTPLILLCRWGQARTTAAVSVMFILVNSISGLLGHIASVAKVPSGIAVWSVAALIGGWIGAELGSRRLNVPWLRRLLGVVLVIAGLKLILA
jgi:hypothetical protein